MPTNTLQVVASVGGVTIQGTISRTEEGQISQEVALPKADKGTLSTRTSDTAGTLTMADAGHGISTGDKIDIFWYASGVLKCGYGATVGTVAGTSVPFTAASGDVLPALDSAVTADVIVEVNTDFDGDDLALILLSSSRDGHFNFVDSTPTSLEQRKLLDGEPFWWYTDCGYTNPLTGNPVDKLYLTNADGDNAATAKLGVQYSSVA